MGWSANGVRDLGAGNLMFFRLIARKFEIAANASTGRAMGKRRKSSWNTPLSRVESLESRELLSVNAVGCFPEPVEAVASATPHAALSAESSQSESNSDDSVFASRAAMVEHLLQDALKRYESYFGKTSPWLVHYESFDDQFFHVGLDDRDPAAGILFNAVSTGTTLSSTPLSYDQTNVQVSGVDEADLVETDGRYIYTVSNNNLVIVDAENGADLQITASLPLTGDARTLYLAGDRLVVESYDYVEVPGESSDGLMPPGIVDYRTQRVISVYDVADRTNPQFVGEHRLNASSSESRLVGSTLFVVSSEGFVLPTPQMVTDGESGAEPAGLIDASNDLWWTQQNYRYETADEYIARMRPYAEQLVASQLADPTATIKPTFDEQTTLVTVSSWDINGDMSAPLDAQSQMLHGAPQIYLDDDRVVLATEINRPLQGTPNIIFFPAVDIDTHLATMTLDSESGLITPEATGELPGRLINRFAIDDRNGTLRIATTENLFQSDDERNSTASSSLYTLTLNEENWAIAGSVTGLAPGESIQSVRFTEDRAYLVTFPVPLRGFDPLFVIDVSDATAPAVLGELEISGFSSYLQVIGETQLLGIGREIDPETGQDLGLQVSLFDVTNPAEPVLIDREHFGMGSGSEAEFDLHAVRYDAESQTLLLPVQTGFAAMPGVIVPWESNLVFVDDVVMAPWQPYDQFVPSQSIVALRVDSTDGLSQLGQASLDGTGARAMILQDHLIARTDSNLYSFATSDLSTQVDRISLSTLARGDSFEVTDASETMELDVLANDQAIDGSELTIVAIEPTYGNSIEFIQISDDGKKLLLSTDTFHDATAYGSWVSYTVEDAYGTESTASVYLWTQPTDVPWIIDPVPVEPGDPNEPGESNDNSQAGDLMEFDVVVTNVDGEQVESVAVGEAFIVEIYVQDLRDDGRGVFSAYADIEFAGVDVTIDGRFEFGEAFPNGHTGMVVGGNVDELGAVSSISVGDNSRTLLAKFSATANSAGSITIVTSAPDDVASDNTLYDRNTEVRAANIHFGSTTIEATSQVEGDMNGDGVLSPIDALLVINALASETDAVDAAFEDFVANQPAAAGGSGIALMAVQNVASVARHSNTRRLDMNRDGHIGPLDAMLIINRFTENTTAQTNTALASTAAEVTAVPANVLSLREAKRAGRTARRG
jgi:hypothetical protein